MDISQKINKMNPVDVSKTERNQILKQNEINVRLLLGHGNVGRKRKRSSLQLIMVSLLLEYVNEQCDKNNTHQH